MAVPKYVLMNSEIEFHDSHISGIAHEGGTVTVTFSKAYIHRSEGRPGIDSGTGWIQAAKLILRDAQVQGALPKFPATLDDGYIKRGGGPTMTSIPLNERGDIEVRFVFFSGQEVVVKTTHAEIHLIGEAEYIEDFPG